MIQSKDYTKLKLEIEKLRWVRISEKTDWDSEKIERELFKIFIEKKEAINNQLPKNKRVEIESEYSL